VGRTIGTIGLIPFGRANDYLSPGRKQQFSAIARVFGLPDGVAAAAGDHEAQVVGINIRRPDFSFPQGAVRINNQFRNRFQAAGLTC